MPKKNKPQQPDKLLESARSLESSVIQLAERGKLREAVEGCKELTASFPAYGSGWYTASHLALQLKNPVAALSAIETALVLQPDNMQWRLHLGSCMMQLGRHAQARQVATDLSARTTLDAVQCASLGRLFSQLELMDESLLQYQRAVEQAPSNGSNYYNLATVQRALGDFPAAEANFTKAIALNQKDYDAWYARSELRHHSADNNHIDELKSLLHCGIDNPRDRVQILYALAREQEDCGDTEQSFDHLQQGAQLRRQHLDYHVDSDIATMAQLRKEYSAALFDASIAGFSSRQPVFVVGLPRSGTTLVERILGSHSAVHAAGELNDFPRQMMHQVKALAQAESKGGQPPGREQLLSLTTRLDFRQLGEDYIRSTQSRSGGATHFIDKLPLNFMYIGLIHLALPEAKIIHLQRNPMDSCYAMYKTLFRDAYPFSYDLQELGNYYLAYRKLMAHWQEAIPGLIHTVDYESLVQDIEPVTRGLLEYCDLGWEQQCLDFHSNTAASTTASAVQVRSALYNTSVGKWRQYARQLQPLAEQLTKAGVDIGQA
ncbi:MAG: sulfotransferase [Halioglobus sp.]